MKARQLSLAAATMLFALQLTTRSWSEEPASPTIAGKLFARDNKAGKNAQTLPPRDAAKACLTTADEMAKGGYRKEAIMLYERARQVDPSQKQVCRYLAVLYDGEGEDSKALTEYNNALKLTPKDSDLLNDFGYYYFSRGDLPKAEQWFRAAIAQSPQHEKACVNLGMTLGQAGRYQESFEAFAKVVSPAAANSNVGMLMAKNGRRDDAARAFQQALTLDPNLKPPRAALAYLETPQTAAQQITPQPLPQAVPSLANAIGQQSASPATSRDAGESARQ